MATWRWARRLRPFMAWAAVSGALEASLPRLAAPAAFNSSECEAKRKPPNVERFLVLLDAGEQGNKNVAVVAEAASWARLLGRTFVEPAMCDSYVVSPYESKVERGNALPAVVGVHARTVSPCAHGNTPFSALRAMRGACAHVAVISIQDWRALVARPGTGPALRDDAYFHDRSEGPSKIGQTNAAPQQQEQRVLYVGCWFRSLSNSQISDGACTMKPCFDVFQFPYSTRLYDFVAKTTARAGKYACVQWRSEKHARATNVERCATELVNAADRALTAERIIGNRLDVPVLFVSDLYGSTSETYSRGDKGIAHVRALNVVQKGLFNSSRVSTSAFDVSRSAGAAAAEMAMPPGSFCMRCGVYCNEKKRCFKNNRICGCSTATKAADATTARRDVPSTPQGRRRRRLLAGGRSAPAAAAAAPPVAPAATSLDEQQPRSRRLAGIGGGRSGDSGTRDLLKSAVSSKADRADDGERAILEQLLCANAPVLVMCHTTSCSNCSRGLSSGYVSAIFQHRKLVFKKSVRSNTRGGIFDWY